jgi:hypothetical protein
MLREEFTKLCGARALFRYFVTLSVTKISNFLAKLTVTKSEGYCKSTLLTAHQTISQTRLEGLDGLHVLRRGCAKLRAFVRRYHPTQASPPETTRAVTMAMNTLGTPLQKAA